MNLTSKLASQFETALASGHLVFTPSTCVVIPNGPINFQIRFAPSLAKKPTGPLARPKQLPTHPPFNPFLTPDPELLVTPLSPSHNLLLNKFSIVKGHAIITTQHWESQLSQLKESEFKAAWALLESGGEYLGFYNCGPLSGASVPHLHMQFIPVTKGSRDDGIPIQPLMDAVNSAWFEETQVPGLPYFHRACRIPPSTSSASFYKDLETAYKHLVTTAFAHLKIDFSQSFNKTVSGSRDALNNTENKPELSYNLIFTRDWMIVIPRRAESFEGVSVNSVGFAGMVLVKSEEQLERLKKVDAVAELLGVVAFDRM
ncbi:bifunctional AP-4-A phosphorylase/ADP sulfurylase [Podochytrium sp. JEL0797]|nr:bifunctional AP-4-A phosphorylase/ADP sulfurylase [Podochytrium sp. JEL0797]